MKKLISGFMFFFLIITFQNAFGVNISKKYFTLKNQLLLEEDGGALEGIKFSREEDLEILMKMVDELIQFEILNDKVWWEEYFIENSVKYLYPLTEYPSLADGINDDFNKCDSKKAWAYRKMNTLIEKCLVLRYIEHGLSRKIGEELVGAINLMVAKDNSDHNRGETYVKSFIENGNYHMIVLKDYLNMLKYRKRTEDILDFFDNHFYKITGRFFNDEYSPIVLNLINYNLKDLDKKRQLIKHFLEESNSQYVTADMSKQSIKSSLPSVKATLIRMLLKDEILTDPALEKEVLTYLKQNPYLMDESVIRNLSKNDIERLKKSDMIPLSGVDDR